MVGFTYRRVPAIALARQLVAEGRIGTVRHVRAQYLQDWIADPAAPMSWRLDKSQAGSGALGDIGAHIVDLTQFITGDRISTVNGMLETFVHERPLPGNGVGQPRHRRLRPGSGTGQVTVDDAAAWLARFDGGALGVFEATRFASGRKNAIRIEVNGSVGSLAFDFEDMNVLHLYDAEEPSATAGFRRILVTEPEHPYVGALVAAGPPARLRARVHPPGRRPGRRARRRRPADAVVRRRSPGADRARRRRDQRRTRHLDHGDP